MDENDLLKQYWEHITQDDAHKIPWEEARKNTEAVESMRESFGFRRFIVGIKMIEHAENVQGVISGILNRFFK